MPGFYLNPIKEEDAGDYLIRSGHKERSFTFHSSEFSLEGHFEERKKVIINNIEMEAGSDLWEYKENSKKRTILLEVKHSLFDSANRIISGNYDDLTIQKLTFRLKSLY